MKILESPTSRTTSSSTRFLLARTRTAIPAPIARNGGGPNSPFGLLRGRGYESFLRKRRDRLELADGLRANSRICALKALR